MKTIHAKDSSSFEALIMKCPICKVENTFVWDRRPKGDLLVTTDNGLIGCRGGCGHYKGFRWSGKWEEVLLFEFEGEEDEKV